MTAHTHTVTQYVYISAQLGSWNVHVYISKVVYIQSVLILIAYSTCVHICLSKDIRLHTHTLSLKYCVTLLITTSKFHYNVHVTTCMASHQKIISCMYVLVYMYLHEL